MKLVNRNIIVFLLLLIGSSNICGQSFFLQNHLSAFTNPNGLNKTSIYSSPYNYMMEISPDEEAGWEITLKGMVDNFFCVDIEDLNLKNVWIHKGDIGIVIQNYDSIPIPIYSSFFDFDTINASKEYVYTGHVAIVYDISEKFVFVHIPQLYIYGWIDRKYLCGSPYTTCN